MSAFDDIDAFFDEDLATSVTAYDDDSVEHTILAIFDSESEIVQDNVVTVKPRLTVRTADVTGLSKNWIFDIGGQAYDVLYQTPDNNGIREIYLTEHNDEASVNN